MSSSDTMTDACLPPVVGRREIGIAVIIFLLGLDLVLLGYSLF